MAIYCELTEYVEQKIIPLYNTFDKAHDVSHVRMVIDESLDLAIKYSVDESMAYVIAAYHDTGLCHGREIHHIVSGEILMNDKRLYDWFSQEDMLLMKEAVEDHRASSDHAPRSLYGCIIAEADRIIDTEITLRRTVQYGLQHNYAASREWHYLRFREHLMKKYAPGGYLKLWLPESKNASRLRELQAVIMNETELRQRFNTIFDQEFFLKR